MVSHRAGGRVKGIHMDTVLSRRSHCILQELVLVVINDDYSASPLERWGVHGDGGQLGYRVAALCRVPATVLVTQVKSLIWCTQPNPLSR